MIKQSQKQYTLMTVQREQTLFTDIPPIPSLSLLPGVSLVYPDFYPGRTCSLSISKFQGVQLKQNDYTFLTTALSPKIIPNEKSCLQFKNRIM